MSSWAVISFGNQRDVNMDKISSFLHEMMSVCQEMGMIIGNRDPPIFHAGTSDLEHTLRTGWVAAGKLADLQPQLLLCFLPNTGAFLYGPSTIVIFITEDYVGEIKRICDTVLGVASQCLLSKHLQGGNKRQYCVNVALKLNVKLGGVNSFLAHSCIPFIAEKPTIVFGCDILYPSLGDPGRPAVASVRLTKFKILFIQ